LASPAAALKPGGQLVYIGYPAGAENLIFRAPRREEPDLIALAGKNEEALAAGSNGSVILEKTGKYVKGKYSLTGGSVGLFEGKKIGRAKTGSLSSSARRARQYKAAGISAPDG